MKESEIARNAAEIEYFERMKKKDKQQDHYINKELSSELGIDLDDLYL